MKNSDKNSEQSQNDLKELVGQLNNVKKNPYVFLVSIVLPLVLYLLIPELYLGVNPAVVFLVVYFIVDSQVEVFLLKKKVRILSDIMRNFYCK